MADVNIISLIKMKPGQTREEFEKRWLEGHTPFGKSWKNAKNYQVFLINEDVQGKQGDPIPFDGIGIMTWDSYEAMIEDFESEQGVAGFADGAKFMDACLNLYCTEYKQK
ncbi:MAG: EthD domain-containing protein [Clostridiales Family XIII bacterium]|jgi:uncharacterized protein (TIGR02118 family)|nr:EthD domain-containing protein [Clostridiales Family XIII bacterium]